jgi:proteasome lid subunit RPN8/RPN11
MFLADPVEQWRAEKAIAARRLSPLAVYHSHPDGGTGLSEFDRSHIAGSKLTAVILAFHAKQRDAPSVAAYRWRRGSIVRVHVNFVEPPN